MRKPASEEGLQDRLPVQNYLELADKSRFGAALIYGDYRPRRLTKRLLTAVRTAREAAGSFWT